MPGCAVLLLHSRLCRRTLSMWSTTSSTHRTCGGLSSASSWSLSPSVRRLENGTKFADESLDQPMEWRRGRLGRLISMKALSRRAAGLLDCGGRLEHHSVRMTDSPIVA